MPTHTIRGRRVTVKRAQSLKLRPVLHPERGKNSYCGPAAVSILTGLDTGQAAALIRAVSGRMSVKGTHSWEVREALAYCGINMRQGTVNHPPGKRLTLAAWHRQWRKDGRFRECPVWLVAAGRHWQVIGARQMCCGRVESIRSIRDPQVKRRAQVTQVFRLDLITPKQPPKQAEGRPGPVLLTQLLNRMFH